MTLSAIQQPTLPRIGEDVTRTTEVVEYLVKLVRILQENFLGTLTTVTNLQLNLSNVGVWYSQLPNSATGTYADGTWRIREIDDNNLVIEHMISGVWTPRFKFR